MPQKHIAEGWKVRKPTSKPKVSPEAGSCDIATAINRAERPGTPLPHSPVILDGTLEPPVTPIEQMLPPPRTPMAPKHSHKRRLSEADAEEEITLDTPPSRLLELITAANTFGDPMSLSTPQRPQSILKTKGLAVFPPNDKVGKRTSQALIQQAESDPSVASRLSSLVDRGRRAGGSPSYTFKRGRSSIRYEYMSSQDEERQPIDESPRKRRREGSPLSKRDTTSLKEMFCECTPDLQGLAQLLMEAVRPCHIPEGIDFDV